MTNFLQKYQSVIGQLNYTLFLVVVALLPFPQIFLRYACVTWLITWLLEGRFLQKPNLAEWKRMLPILLFGLWYLWKIISGLWANDQVAYTWQLERYMLFGAMIPIGIWGVNEQYNWKKICSVLVISCIAAAGVYLFTLFWVQNANVFYREIPLQTMTFEYFASKISYIKHRLFLCSVEMMGVMAILFIRKDILEKWGKVKGWLAIISAIAIMAILILATGSRASILSGIALIAIGVLYKLPIRSIRYKIGFILLAGGIGLFALTQHPRMQDFDFNQILKLREIKAENNIRLNIWGVIFENYQAYSLHGLGAGQSFGFLQEKYNEYGLLNYKYFNAHNQYFEEWMEIGIPGVLFFLLAWISIPCCATGRARKSAMMLFILYVLNMLTDCMLGKFDGIVLWCVWMILIYIQSDKEPNKQIERNTA